MAAREAALDAAKLDALLGLSLLRSAPRWQAKVAAAQCGALVLTQLLENCADEPRHFDSRLARKALDEAHANALEVNASVDEAARPLAVVAPDFVAARVDELVSFACVNATANSADEHGLPELQARGAELLALLADAFADVFKKRRHICVFGI